jgi:predicted N-acetyltransferase YhbS
LRPVDAERLVTTAARYGCEIVGPDVGPVAVDPHLQGLGIGSDLMRALCRRMDAAGEEAYLETDKEINVRFYERFGFEVVGEEDVLGVPGWIMLRHPKKRG